MDPLECHWHICVDQESIIIIIIIIIFYEDTHITEVFFSGVLQ